LIGSDSRTGSYSATALVGPDRQCELLVGTSLASVGEARSVIRHTLSDVSAECVDRAAICGSELVANALRHATPPIVLSVVVDHDHVVVAVEDASRQPPVPRVPGADDTGGRGTLMVGRFSDRWGVEFLPHGKRVWCTIMTAPD